MPYYLIESVPCSESTCCLRPSARCSHLRQVLVSFQERWAGQLGPHWLLPRPSIVPDGTDLVAFIGTLWMLLFKCELWLAGPLLSLSGNVSMCFGWVTTHKFKIHQLLFLFIYIKSDKTKKLPIKWSLIICQSGRKDSWKSTFKCLHWSV